MTKEEIIEEANRRFPQDKNFVWHHNTNLTAMNNAYGFIQGALFVYGLFENEKDPNSTVKISV